LKGWVGKKAEDTLKRSGEEGNYGLRLVWGGEKRPTNENPATSFIGKRGCQGDTSGGRRSVEFYNQNGTTLKKLGGKLNAESGGQKVVLSILFQ